MSESEDSVGGIGLGGLLTILFVTLKLLDKITWSWWWVLSPLWIPVVVVSGIFLLGVFGLSLGHMLFKGKR